MKSLLACLNLALALACATAQGADAVPVIDQPGFSHEADTAVAAPAASSAPVMAVAVPEPDVLPMLAVGAVLVALRLGRKKRNDKFK